jgi:hypothetical protein
LLELIFFSADDQLDRPSSSLSNILFPLVDGIITHQDHRIADYWRNKWTPAAFLMMRIRFYSRFIPYRSSSAWKVFVMIMMMILVATRGEDLLFIIDTRIIIIIAILVVHLIFFV